MSTNNPRPSKAERTASAREKASQMRAAQDAAAKRKSLFVKLGVLGAVILVIALVVTLIVQNNNAKVADSGAVPAGGNAALRRAAFHPGVDGAAPRGSVGADLGRHRPGREGTPRASSADLRWTGRRLR